MSRGDNSTGKMITASERCSPPIWVVKARRVFCLTLLYQKEMLAPERCLFMNCQSPVLSPDRWIDAACSVYVHCRYYQLTIYNVMNPSNLASSLQSVGYCECVASRKLQVLPPQMANRFCLIQFMSCLENLPLGNKTYTFDSLWTSSHLGTPVSISGITSQYSTHIKLCLKTPNT